MGDCTTPTDRARLVRADELLRTASDREALDLGNCDVSSTASHTATRTGDTWRSSIATLWRRHVSVPVPAASSRDHLGQLRSQHVVRPRLTLHISQRTNGARMGQNSAGVRHAECLHQSAPARSTRTNLQQSSRLRRRQYSARDQLQCYRTGRHASGCVPLFYLAESHHLRQSDVRRVGSDTGSFLRSRHPPCRLLHPHRGRRRLAIPHDRRQLERLTFTRYNLCPPPRPSRSGVPMV